MLTWTATWIIKRISNGSEVGRRSYTDEKPWPAPGSSSNTNGTPRPRPRVLASMPAILLFTPKKSIADITSSRYLDNRVSIGLFTVVGPYYVSCIAHRASRLPVLILTDETTDCAISMSVTALPLSMTSLRPVLAREYHGARKQSRLQPPSYGVTLPLVTESRSLRAGSHAKTQIRFIELDI